MPTNTDLVTDLPADFEVFGQAVDTTLADLKGGTTGQILSKATNTDMDFVWIANDQGDITGVTAGTGISGGGTSGTVTITNSMATEITAKGDLIVGTGSATFDNLPAGTNGYVLVTDSTTATGLKWTAAVTGDITAVNVTSPITGGGTSGDVTIAIQDALTTQKGAVQLSDSTSTTSSILAATPTAVKSAYDLAAAAIPKSTATAKGNVFTATAASTPAVLAVGTNGQVLTADSTTATGLAWSSAGGVTGWTSYTPTWTNLTVGNGTLTAAYRDNGNMIDVQMRLIFGSTTSISGSPSFTLPFNAQTSDIDTYRAGGRYLDSGVRDILSYFQVKTSTATCVYAYTNFNVTGVNYEIMSNIGASDPWVWTTNDQITAFFSYRKA